MFLKIIIVVLSVLTNPLVLGYLFLLGNSVNFIKLFEGLFLDFTIHSICGIEGVPPVSDYLLNVGFFELLFRIEDYVTDRYER
jgi:hypothetical protein